MLDNGHPKDVDISRALTENYESVEMGEAYRRKLLSNMLDTVSPRRRRLPALRWLFGAAAAAVVVLAYLGVTHLAGTRPSNERLFAVTEVSKLVTDGSGRELKIGDYLASGERVSTGRGGRVTLVAKNGSLIHLDERSELTVDIKGHAAISRGRLYCSNRMHEIKTIQTPAGSIRLLGTVLDASVVKQDTTAVTVVEGKVQLSNSHGRKIVAAGNRAMMVATQAPEGGIEVNTAAQTAWYDGRNSIVSDSDEIAYIIQKRKGLPREERYAVTELWVMESDGSNKRLVKTLVGRYNQLGGWWPGSQWILLRSQSPVNMVDPSRPVQTNMLRLVNVMTGQDDYLPLPADFNLESASVSPDGMQVAINGAHESNNFRPGFTGPWRGEGGIWIYNVQTREMKLLLTGEKCVSFEPLAWSPDGRWLATSQWKGNNIPRQIVLIDTQTGQTRQIGSGGEPAFSPDGTRLAYCGPGSILSVSVCVTDTSGSGKALRLVPENIWCESPTWSPDGGRVAFFSQERRGHSYTIHVAEADGSGVRDVYSAQGNMHSISWGRDASTIYVRTWSDGVFTVASDGSGLIARLGGNEEDSNPPPDVREQLTQARSVIAKAEHDIYMVGYIRVFQGRLDEARSALQEAASSISSVPWAYPLARISVPDVTAEANEAYESASAKDSDLLSIACWYRISIVDHSGLGDYCRGQVKLPPDIQTLEQSKRFGMSTEHTDSRMDGLTCPGRDNPKPVPFIYTPPKNGVPKIGDVIFQCPNHPEHRIVWDRFLEYVRNKPVFKPAVKK